MPYHGNHRVSPIDSALTDAVPRMCMYISKDFETCSATERPQRRTASGMKRDGTTAICIRIQIVIADESRSFPSPVPRVTEQKRATFTTPGAAVAKLAHDLSPEQDWNSDFPVYGIRRQGGLRC